MTRNKAMSNAFETSVSILGDGWNLLILRAAFEGKTRFEDFKRTLGIAPTMLTKRLRFLTEVGVLTKERYNDRPPRDEYRITPAGLDLFPILTSIREWGLKHFGDNEPAEIMIDLATGKPIRTEFVDLNSGRAINMMRIGYITAQEDSYSEPEPACADEIAERVTAHAYAMYTQYQNANEEK
ncbi:winged helix-turn-helix transcriptional regulator [Psittacicella hinzii]|uniref:HTH hxlR-type domain-containing protein n=1 Tax=Psittacicella hinzii TaxID=2028575 RepID=A0A3A1YM99_9GAMM|nr:helix-turn-helix domain-containing protein [Psittacicella hinzii]RIY37147.1 hypothetical protein CKF58_05175 [Psittacicella hinzii]